MIIDRFRVDDDIVDVDETRPPLITDRGSNPMTSGKRGALLSTRMAFVYTGNDHNGRKTWVSHDLLESMGFASIRNKLLMW